MFDRYAGDNKRRLEWNQNLPQNSTSNLCLPTLNLVSFFTAHNTNSAPKRLRDKRRYKDLQRHPQRELHRSSGSDLK